MALQQFLMRGDNADTVHTPWMRSRGNTARCFMKMIYGSITGSGKFMWTVETKNTEDVDSSATTVVSQQYGATGLPAIKEAVTTSGMKELYRYVFSLDTNAAEGDYMWYQCMDPIWQPTYA